MSKKTERIYVLDTTLRDGEQAAEFSLSLKDKIRIAQKLDELGVDYIEGGWPGANPTDTRFFQEMKEIPLKRARLVAFGSTHHPKYTTKTDPNLKALVESGVEAVTLFGKSWTLHVEKALKVTLEKNLELVGDSVRYMKERLQEVFFDAEHFFDGFKEDKDYALAVLRRAYEAGADFLVLCDTNGGCLPEEVREIVREVRKHLKGARLGIHAHNDTECAVANTLAAVKEGCTMVQGTINGIGERCGNANLCSIIPNLVLKLGYKCQAGESLRKLTEVSRFVYEVANLDHPPRLPYVGKYAFAHKGGVHVSAILKDPRTYEHIDPELVGNSRRVVVSDLSGRSNILYKINQFGIKLEDNEFFVRRIVEEIKRLEAEGYEFEAAEASLELLIYKLLGEPKEFFEVLTYHVTDFCSLEDEKALVEASIIVRVPPRVGSTEHVVAGGVGPVNALDNALRKALLHFYPYLEDMKLEDYKVRVLSDRRGTESLVRVFIFSRDRKHTWGTVGVSKDILEASCRALMDSYTYCIFKHRQEKDN